MEKIGTIENFVTPFGKEDLTLYKGEYSDGQIAIVANLTETGEPFGKFTVNLVSLGIVAEPGNVIISDYSENEGIYEELIKHGIIGKPINRFTINQFGSTALEAKILV